MRAGLGGAEFGVWSSEFGVRGLRLGSVSSVPSWLNRIGRFGFFAPSALLYSRITHFREEVEQEDRGVREADETDLSPIFPAFLFNPAWSPLVAAPPR